MDCVWRHGCLHILKKPDVSCSLPFSNRQLMTADKYTICDSNNTTYSKADLNLEWQECDDEGNVRDWGFLYACAGTRGAHCLE